VDIPLTSCGRGIRRMVFSNMLSAFQKTKWVASLRAALRKSGNDFAMDDWASGV
jgi:hypothetical protein